MKNVCAAFILMIGFLSLVITDVYGQRWTKRRRYNTVGVNLSAINYLGETAPDASFTSLRLASTRPSLGVTFTRKFTPRVSARGSFSWGRLYGNDKQSAPRSEDEDLPRFKRNLNFRNDIKELSGVAIFNLYENRRSYSRRRDFSPYGFAGLAVFHHNPKAYYNGGNGLESGYYALQPLGTEGQFVKDRESKNYPKPYSRIQIAIPVGIGINYKLDRYWDVGFEVSWRKTFTDYLDDISSNYADKADLLEARGREAALLSDRSGDAGFTPVQSDVNGFQNLNGFGRKGDQRGDVSDKDWYFTAGFTLNYILPARIGGPRFR
jgi:hypothetical protein